jgi:hypothetical protein
VPEWGWAQDEKSSAAALDPRAMRVIFPYMEGMDGVGLSTFFFRTGSPVFISTTV